MKLSGTRGVTQKTMTFDTHVCLILATSFRRCKQTKKATCLLIWLPKTQDKALQDVVGLRKLERILKNKGGRSGSRHGQFKIISRNNDSGDLRQTTNTNLSSFGALFFSTFSV